MLTHDDYERMMDEGAQLSAELDAHLEESPDNEALRATQEFLADRYASLLFLSRQLIVCSPRAG